MANGSIKGIVEITISDDEEEEKAPIQTSPVPSTSSSQVLADQNNFTNRIEPESDSSESSEEETEEENGQIEAITEDPCKNIFEKFMAQCSKLLELPGDQPIIDKLQKQYECVHLSFRQSSKFRDFLEEYIQKLERLKNQRNVYSCIQNLKHEMKKYKNGPSKKIEIYERHLAKIDKEIKRQQEREVNWDDDDQSSYIYEAKLKMSFMKTYHKLMELTGSKVIRSHIGGKKYKYEGTRYPEINKKITQFVRKRNSFPDYTEIVYLIRETNEKHGKFLSEEGVLQLAKEAFVDVGEDLKQIRLREFRNTIGCHLTDAVDLEATDPAGSDESLRKRLDENKAIGKQRLNEVVEKYAAEQVRLKLEPKEEGDGIDSGSSEGDDDEDGDTEEGSEHCNGNDAVKESVGDPSDLSDDDQPSCSHKIKENGPEASVSETPAQRPTVISSDVAQEPLTKKRRIVLESADDDDVIVLD